jgi:hypothetical protein
MTRAPVPPVRPGVYVIGLGPRAEARPLPCCPCAQGHPPSPGVRTPGCSRAPAFPAAPDDAPAAPHIIALPARCGRWPGLAAGTGRAEARRGSGGRAGASGPPGRLPGERGRVGRQGEHLAALQRSPAAGKPRSRSPGSPAQRASATDRRRPARPPRRQRTGTEPSTPLSSQGSCSHALAGRIPCRFASACLSSLDFARHRCWYYAAGVLE